MPFEEFDAPLLRPLVEEFGWPRVAEVGLRVLGYPPGLVHTVSEVLEIEQELKR